VLTLTEGQRPASPPQLKPNVKNRISPNICQKELDRFPSLCPSFQFVPCGGAMKRKMSWLGLPGVVAATLTIATAAYSNPVQTPLASPVTISGNSGGGQSSQCGFISNTPSQVIVVNQPTPLRFKLQGQGQPTLWITGPIDRCVMADGLSNGEIELPGVWEPGTYSVYVGDLAQGSHPYTLSITQE
jgi:hypothetical protein